jgi:hypothetical protein
VGSDTFAFTRFHLTSPPDRPPRDRLLIGPRAGGYNGKLGKIGGNPPPRVKAALLPSLEAVGCQSHRPNGTVALSTDSRSTCECFPRFGLSKAKQQTTG